MKIQVAIIFISLLVSLNGHQISKLSQEQFIKQLQSSQSVWLTYQGKQQNAILQQVATVLKGIAEIAHVSNDKNNFYFYGDDRENPVVYDGLSNGKSVIDFVLKNMDSLLKERSKQAQQRKKKQQLEKYQHLQAQQEWNDELVLRQKSETIILNSSNWNIFLKSHDAYIINFYKAKCNQCKELNKQWQGVTIQLSRKLKVAKINLSQEINQNLEKQLKLEKYPSIRFYQAGIKKVENYVQFDGVQKKFSITEWIISKLNQKKTSIQIPSLSKATYQQLCKGTKSTCVIFFIEDQSDEMKEKMAELWQKYIKKPIVFMINEKGSQNTFEGQVGVQKYPNTVMMYPKLKKMWRMDSIDFSAINNAIEEITLGNRNNFEKYNFVEELS